LIIPNYSGLYSKDDDRVEESSKNGITIIRKVLVKAIVTEEFKKKLLDELSNSTQQAETRLQQLEFEKKRISLRSGQSPKDQMAARQLEVERERLKGMHQQFTRKREEIVNLELDSEYLQGTIDSPIFISEGDSFYDLLTKTEIVIKDGNVVEIRNS